MFETGSNLFVSSGILKCRLLNSLLAHPTRRPLGLPWAHPRDHQVRKEGRELGPRLTANLRSKILDFGGFDSSIILILRRGILMSKGNFPESLSQAILVAIMLGRLGVLSPASGRGRDKRGFHRMATTSLHIAMLWFKCAHVATFWHMLSHVATCCHMLQQVATFSHIFPWKLISGNRGTSATIPFVLTPFGSFHIDI